MTLRGDAAKEFANQVRAHHEARNAQRLADAKADALRRNKEPFDLQKLESLCDTSSEGRIAPLEERLAKFEWKYYVSNPNVMTIEEFAKEVEELSRW